MAPAVPVIEAADDTYPHGVWSPDDKVNPGNPVYRPHMGSQRVVSFEQSSFREEMQIVVAHHG